VAVVSESESNTFTIPPFSPTNTLPPGAKAIAVGRASPLQTATSENPVGTAAALTAGEVGAADRVAGPRTSPRRSGGVTAAPAGGDSSVNSSASRQRDGRRRPRMANPLRTSPWWLPVWPPA
jgi:hypothetical protein